MERGLKTKMNPIDDACDTNIDQDFSIKDQELLKELNNIICHVDNSYLWRELSEFDLKLRKRLKDNNINKETSIQQKASQALREINQLDGEDNLFQYILCLLKYSTLPVYSINHKDLKTRLTNHLVSHSNMERGLRATINPIDDVCNNKDIVKQINFIILNVTCENGEKHDLKFDNFKNAKNTEIKITSDNKEIKNALGDTVLYETKSRTIQINLECKNYDFTVI